MADPRPYSFLVFLLVLLWRPFARDKAQIDARIAATRERDALCKADREMAKVLKGEAKINVQLIQETLMRLGEFYAPMTDQPHGKQAGGRRKGLKRFLQGNTRKVGFEQIATSPEILWYRLKIHERGWFAARSALPHQVRVADLMKDETTYELSAACERRVSWQYDPFLPEQGAWFLVHRLEGTGGIPKHITFQDMLSHAPEDMSGLSLVIGVGPHRRVKMLSMYESPQWLIAGPTRTGKSNLINSLILQLMYHMSPNEVRFVLCDMKEMVEFGVYEDSPYLWAPPAPDYEAALETLGKVRDEIRRRLRMLRESGKTKDYYLFNKLYPERAVPAILVIIDEAAQLMNMGSSVVREEAVKLISGITALGRAAGVYMVVCTQQPTVQVLDSQIKGNLPVRIAFRCTHHTQSGVIIGRGDAAYLPDVKGRCVYVEGADTVECQVPFVRQEDTDSILRMVRERQQTAAVPESAATPEREEALNLPPFPAPAPLPAQEPFIEVIKDHLLCWLEDNTERDEAALTPIAALYADYVVYCTNNHHLIEMHRKRGFAIRLYEIHKFLPFKGTDGIRLVRGLQLKADVADGANGGDDLYDAEAAR